ncbi:hypothetical protein FMUND_13603 [Fusarium mundagurra]|uniref:Uncharacterized protein n=1 Tax=Fusarium mundagurra TaxID=1567541 RepID=A0A8H5XY16_9HYPO|nr:hypothetical protein FMUND_13603 [Fusarium mundagurra]
MSMQQGPGTPNARQLSWSNNQKASDAIGESMMKAEAKVKTVLSELYQARTAALQAEKEREHFETSFNNLQKEYKALKEESEQKDKRIEELKQAGKHYEDRVFLDDRRSWREWYMRR